MTFNSVDENLLNEMSKNGKAKAFKSHSKDAPLRKIYYDIRTGVTIIDDPSLITVVEDKPEPSKGPKENKE